MDNTDHNLVQAALSRAKHLGIEADFAPHLNGERAGGLVRLGRGRKMHTYVAEVKKGLRPATLGAALYQLQRTGKPLLLIADYVTPPLAEKLRERGVAFVDAAGNAFIDQPPIYVWIKGEKPQTTLAARQVAGRAFQAAGLKVLFALLCHPQWVGQPYREIARLAGVAHGTVGWVMAELPQLGFVAEVKGKRRLLQPEVLLKQWAEAYARTLRPKIVIGRYRTELQRWWNNLNPHKYGLLLGAEAAAERVTGYLRPGTITLYGERAEPRLLIDFKLKKDPAGPVEILERFWQADQEARVVVPLPLIYADLLYIGDARCLEAADLIYEKIVDGFER